MRKAPSSINLALRLAAASVCMFGFGFALVPLYDVFCEVVGIRAPITVSEAGDLQEQPDRSRTITLELLANTGKSAPWTFRPVADRIEVHTGLIQHTDYTARSLAAIPISGIATPDVKPVEAGRYFRKIECFCFTEQEFAAGEERQLPVTFFVDPDLPAHIDTITLSYTLFEQQRVAGAN